MGRLNIYLLVSSLICCFASCKPAENKAIPSGETYKIGTIFHLDHIVDTTGKEIVLDFSTAKINVIDIWNNTCPPCIEEMKQFPGIVEQKKTKIHIYSLSLTQFYIWEKTVRKHSGTFAFLENAYPFWNQYNLMTTDNPAFKNGISGDRFEELMKLYHTKGNPEYFILDEHGKIIARPESAVAYLQKLD